MASFIPLAIINFELPGVVLEEPEVPPAIDPPHHGIGYLLEVVGLKNPAERLRIMEAGLAEHEEKDIRDMTEEFSKRTVAFGRINFGIGSTKRLIVMMHWIKDCFRTDDDPDSLRFD
jgi:hypothetical protein